MRGVKIHPGAQEVIEHETAHTKLTLERSLLLNVWVKTKLEGFMDQHIDSLIVEHTFLSCNPNPISACGRAVFIPPLKSVGFQPLNL